MKLNSLTKQCVPFNQLQHLPAFPVFRLVPSGFAQIGAVVSACPPATVPIFCIQGGSALGSGNLFNNI